MSRYRGPFASQARPGDWNDCVATSGLNMSNAAGARRPTTHAEIDALRVASGDTVGAQNLTTLDRGINARYHRNPARSSTRVAIQNGIATGRWFVIHGNYWTLPDYLEVQKPPKDRFSHAVAIGPGDNPNEVWWVDGLEPPIVHGRSVPIHIALDFAGTNGYDALSLPEAPRPTHAGHGVIHVSGRPFFRYTVRLRLITGRVQVTGRTFSATTSPAVERYWPTNSGWSRKYSIAQVADKGSAYDGWWIGTEGQDYTEVTP